MGSCAAAVDATARLPASTSNRAILFIGLLCCLNSTIRRHSLLHMWRGSAAPPRVRPAASDVAQDFSPALFARRLQQDLQAGLKPCSTYASCSTCGAGLQSCAGALP